MAQVQVLAVAHYFKEGSRGMCGGAAQNDKIWGLAKVGSTMVRFWGRRNGGLKFKTEVHGIGSPIELLKAKVRKGYEEMGPRTTKEFCPTLEQDLVSHYYSAMSRGIVNTQH